MKEEDSWGELRSQLNGQQTRHTFCKLLGWLEANRSFCEQDEVQRYLRDYLKTWPDNARSLWEDEPMTALDLEKQWIHIIKPRIPSRTPLTTFLEPTPACVATQLGNVTLTSCIDDKFAHSSAVHAGYHASATHPYWAWEHEDWSVQVRAQLFPANEQPALEYALFFYRSIAHAPADRHSVQLDWHPTDECFPLTGEEVVHPGETGFHWRGGTASPDRRAAELCMGTNEQARAVERCHGWWPDPEIIQNVSFYNHGMKVELSPMQATQRIQIVFALSWGRTRPFQTYVTMLRLLNEFANPDDLTTR